jgi:hypothetical protein
MKTEDHVRKLLTDLPIPSREPDVQWEEFISRAHSDRRKRAITSTLGVGMMIVLVAVGASVLTRHVPGEMTTLGGPKGLVSITPSQVRPGETATLVVREDAGTWGVGWRVERWTGDRWKRIGLLSAGPTKDWPAIFDFSRKKNLGVPLIGFGGGASIPIEIPELEPGLYRVGQDFGYAEEDDKYAEFEILD